MGPVVRAGGWRVEQSRPVKEHPMFDDNARHPLRRLRAGLRALGQAAIGLALMAVAALAFLPGAHAAVH